MRLYSCSDSPKWSERSPASKDCSVSGFRVVSANYLFRASGFLSYSFRVVLGFQVVVVFGHCDSWAVM